MATLTFDYRQSIAVLGPLGTTSEPHSWDLCDFHGGRMTAPRGWEMLRNLPAYSAASVGSSVGSSALDDDLTAIADSLRDAATRSAAEFSPAPDRPARSLPPVGAMRIPEGLGGSHPAPPTGGAPQRPGPKHAARPGRRGHLRVLPDPVD